MDFTVLVLLSLFGNPSISFYIFDNCLSQAAVNFALMMSQMEGGCPVDYNTITDLFLQVQILSSLNMVLSGDDRGHPSFLNI